MPRRSLWTAPPGRPFRGTLLGMRPGITLDAFAIERLLSTFPAGASADAR